MIVKLIQRIKQFMGYVQTAKARELYQMDQLAVIVGGRAMIEIIGYIFGIGFLIWLVIVLRLWLIVNYWGDR